MIGANVSYLAGKAFESYRHRGFLGDGAITKSVPADEQKMDIDAYMAMASRAEAYSEAKPLSHDRGLEVNISQVEKGPETTWLNRENFSYDATGQIFGYSRTEVRICPDFIERLGCHTDGGKLSIYCTRLDLKDSSKSFAQDLKVAG